MKKILSAALALCMAAVPCLAEDAEQAGGSWGQINQSLQKEADWQQWVRDPSAFQLGEAQALAGSEGLYLQDWGTYPSIDGSTVCVPLAVELARQWLGLEESDLNGFVNFSTTPYAYDRLTYLKPNPMVTIPSRGIIMDDTHPVDLVLGTGPNADETAAAEAADADLVRVPICFDAFVFLVNGQNPVDGLTADQIRAVYTGAVRTWDKLGGEKDIAITAFRRPHGSGSETAMEELVMRDMRMTAAEENSIADGMSDLVREIGNYDNGAGAIGYSYLYYVESLYRSGLIKVLSVDGVEPTPENLRSMAYPFTVHYYAVYRRDNENAAAFAAWLQSDEGQRCIAQAGYVPLRELD